MPNNNHLIGTFIRSFLVDEITEDRNLSANTRKSYCDTIRLLLRYIQDHKGTDPTRVRVEQVNATLA